MSEEVPLYNGPTIVVTADDSTLFTCTPYEMGGMGTARAVRWRLIDAKGRTYTGPAYTKGATLEDVQRLVSQWWEGKKALGQSGVNAETARRWLVDGR